MSNIPGVQTLKVKRAIPTWVIGALVLVIIIFGIVALGLSGVFGNFFGNMLSGLGTVAVWIFTVPYQWAGTNLAQGAIFTVIALTIVVGLSLVIAKRRYLFAQKVNVTSPYGSTGYAPTNSMGSPQIYSTPPILQPTAIPSPPIQPVTPEQKDQTVTTT